MLSAQNFFFLKTYLLERATEAEKDLCSAGSYQLSLGQVKFMCMIHLQGCTRWKRSGLLSDAFTGAFAGTQSGAARTQTSTHLGWWYRVAASPHYSAITKLFKNKNLRFTKETYDTYIKSMLILKLPLFEELFLPLDIGF